MTVAEVQQRSARAAEIRAGSVRGQIGKLTTEGGTPLTEEMLRTMPVSFINLASPATFSGYKAHVFATDTDGARSILTRLQHELAGPDNPGGWGAKVATDRFHQAIAERTAMSGKTHPQTGKAVTVYFPDRDNWKNDLAYLKRLMADLPPRQHKPVESETYAGNGVSWRYELREGAPQRNLTSSEYHDWYESAY